MNQIQLKEYLTKLNNEKRYIVKQNWKRDERTGMFRAKPKQEVEVLVLNLESEYDTKDYTINNQHKKDRERRLKEQQKKLHANQIKTLTTSH